MILLSFLMLLTGLAAMGLSQSQHHGWLFRHAADAARSSHLRRGGLLIILLGLAPAIQRWGWAVGLTGWLGLLSLAAALLLLARTYLPQPPRR